MSPRTGRPKVDNPQNQRFSIRLDDNTGKRLDAYCEREGKTRAAVIRDAIARFLDAEE